MAAAAPATTVMVPEAVAVREPEVAEIFAVPTSTPVITALRLSPAGTRLASATPPVLLVNDQVPAALATKLPIASRVIENTVKVLPEVKFCAPTTVPLPLAKVSTFIVAAAPAITVMVPEAVGVSPPEVAEMFAVPISPPVITALRLPVPATRSPRATPPVKLVKAHVPGALATKLPAKSRVIENTVNEFPEVKFCAPTTVPLPLAAVSTRMAAAAPAITVMVPEAPVKELAVTEMFAVPIKTPVITALLVSTAATMLPSATPLVLLVNDHTPAALATKLPAASRVIEYTVKAFPDVKFCAVTTVPEPFAAVSTVVAAAAPALSVIVVEVAAVNGDDVN